MPNLTNYWQIQGENIIFASLAAAKNHVRHYNVWWKLEKRDQSLEIIHMVKGLPVACVTVKVSCLGNITFSRAVKF